MTTKKPRLLLGAHISIAGGLEKAIERGESIGCTAIQIFTKSNRQWNARQLQEHEISLFKKATHQSRIASIIAHASYLINIASNDPKIEKLSVHALSEELARCQQLAIPFLVIHPGSYRTGTPKEGLERINDNLNMIFDANPGAPTILLETMAGQGSSLGATFEEIAFLIEASAYKERLGVCFDTCHAFVAGYDLRNIKEYEKTWYDFNTIIGMKYLKAIHLNDSKKGLGSNIDRHEHIGKGQLGTQAFELLCNDEKLFDVPKILETPKDSQDPLKDDVMNMQIIYALLHEKTKKMLM